MSVNFYFLRRDFSIHFISKSISKCDKYPRNVGKTILCVLIHIQAYKNCLFLIIYFISIFVLTNYNFREVLCSASHRTITEQKDATFSLHLCMYVYLYTCILLSCMYHNDKKLYRGMQRMIMRSSCRCLEAIPILAKYKVCTCLLFKQE